MLDGYVILECTKCKRQWPVLEARFDNEFVASKTQAVFLPELSKGTTVCPGCGKIHSSWSKFPILRWPKTNAVKEAA